MKKNLLIALCLLLFISCQKEDEKFCWECNVNSSSTYSGNIGEFSFDAQTSQCDLTANEIKEIEGEGSTTVTENIEGETMTTKTSTSCNRK
jgi:hypothetical protein